MGTVWAIVVAAGTGDRFGRPKQFEILGGRRVVDWAVDAARKACDGVVTVLPPGHADGEGAVEGGATRSASVRAGLAAVPPDAEIVVVHDAARPLAEPELFDRVVGAVRGGADGAIAAAPLTDTVKGVDGDRVVETLDRRALVAVQTPQAFRATTLRTAHAGDPEATDDAALVEAAGGTVVVVAAPRWNLKITEPGDLAVAEALLKAQS